jgi:TM2 domain-containing membrane protein YozV
MKAKEPRIITFLLCLFFGPLGIHRFYLRKKKTALCMLLSLGGVGIWYLIDLALIVKGKLQRKEGKSFPLKS